MLQEACVFQKCGNKKQVVFYLKVDETLVQVENYLAAIAASPTSAPTLQLIKQLLQKLRGHGRIYWRRWSILPGGGGIYCLVEVSDNERRIEKPELEAERKDVKCRKKCSERSTKSKGGPPGFPVAMKLAAMSCTSCNSCVCPDEAASSGPSSQVYRSMPLLWRDGASVPLLSS